MYGNVTFNCNLLFIEVDFPDSVMVSANILKANTENAQMHNIQRGRLFP